MADSKISDLNGGVVLTSIAANDKLEVVDVSDTSMAATGTNKPTEVQYLAAAVSSALGLGSMATQAASNVAITGGSVAGITDLAVADGGTGASTAADARTNLGLGTMATATASDYLAKVAAGASVENIGAVESNVSTVAASGATETLDTSTYGVFDVTMDQACEFTFSNPAPSGKCTSFVLILRGAFTPTFPAAVDWGNASAPTYTTPSVYVFTTVDAGTTWLGSQVGKAFG